MILVIVALLVSSSFAHMMMDKPCARSSPTCHSSGRKDYDLPAPLNYRPEPKIGGSFPCKSHTQQGSPTFTVRPGESIATRFTGSDNHDGGHCQFALSYDNGRTWAVVRTILHDCMSGRGTGPYSYSVPVPESAASGRVVLGWLFYNKEGDQEVYMNCADGEIQDGRSNGYIGGKELLVLRLNGYRKLGEWKYGGDDGVGMFNARRDVVIRANETITDPEVIASNNFVTTETAADASQTATSVNGSVPSNNTVNSAVIGRTPLNIVSLVAIVGIGIVV